MPGGGAFGPNDPITREQLEANLWRCADSSEIAYSLTQSAGAGQVSNYAKSALAWVNKRGIVNGTGSGALDPKGTAIRAQAAPLPLRYRAETGA